MSVRAARKRFTRAAWVYGFRCIPKRGTIERMEVMVAVGWIKHWRELMRKHRAQRRVK